MLALPPGSELNPLAASYPWLALIAKGLLCLALVAWPWRYALRVQTFGALAWGAGALTNAAVLL